MVNFLRNFFRMTVVAAAVAGFAAPANAEVLMRDDFAYDTGNLYNQGGWVKLSTNTENPMQVVDLPLTYAGYQGEASGKAVRVTTEASTKTQRL